MWIMDYDLNIVSLIKKNINTQNNIVNSNVPPANAIAIITPNKNRGNPIYCIINGKNVK